MSKNRLPPEEVDEAPIADTVGDAEGESSTDEETQLAAPAEDEVPMPEQTLTAEYGGMSFTITVPESTLPEGSSLEIQAVGQESVQANVNELINKGVKQVKAFQFVFKNVDGETVTPANPVTVSLTGYDR